MSSSDYRCKYQINIQTLQEKKNNFANLSNNVKTWSKHSGTAHHVSGQAQRTLWRINYRKRVMCLQIDDDSKPEKHNFLFKSHFMCQTDIRRKLIYKSRRITRNVGFYSLQIAFEWCPVKDSSLTGLLFRADQDRKWFQDVLSKLNRKRKLRPRNLKV